MAVPVLLLLIAGGVAALAGLVLFVLGVRGRRVGREPHCRGCGFDLTGIASQSAVAQSSLAQSTFAQSSLAQSSAGGRCPECGRDVSLAESVRYGRRRVRLGLLVAGLLLFLAAGAGVGALGVRAVAGVNWNTYKPLWLLRLEAVGTNFEADAALAEIVLRIENEGLRAPAVRRLVEQALALQANPVAVWNEGWGDVVVSAERAYDALSDSELAAFLDRAVDVRLNVREKVLLGRPTRVSVSVSTARGPGGTGVQLRSSAEAATLDGEPWTATVLPAPSRSTVRSGGSSTYSTIVAFPETLPAGPHTLAVHLTGHLALEGDSVDAPAASIELPPPADAVAAAPQDGTPPPRGPAPFRRVVETGFMSLAAGSVVADLIRPLDFAPHADAMAKSLSLTTLQRTTNPSRQPEHRQHWRVQINAANLPVPASFEVWLVDPRDESRRAMISRVAFPPGVSHTWGVGGDNALDLDRVTVLLIASEDAAYEASDIAEECWRGEIVFHDVPLSPSDEVIAAAETARIAGKASETPIAGPAYTHPVFGVAREPAPAE